MEIIDGTGVKVGHMVAVRVLQQAAEVQGLRPVGHQLFPDPQQIAAAHQLIHGADAQGRHILPQLLGHEFHEVHHVLRLAGEAGPELGILGGNARRAGVQVAHPHHAAA